MYNDIFLQRSTGITPVSCDKCQESNVRLLMRSTKISPMSYDNTPDSNDS
jgi:hypothetical protein